MLNKISSSLLPVRQVKSILFSAAIAVFSLTSCKDDDEVKPDDGQNTEDKAFLPAKDQVYTYKIEDSDGVKSSSEMRVTSVKDSAGIPVYNVENVITEELGKVKTNNRAYSNNGSTTYELSYPEGLSALNTYIKEFAVIEDYKLTGFPQQQIFENKGTVDSKVTFSKEPINLKLELLIPVEEGDAIEATLECKLTYVNGEATKQESITTPAGTFNCTKWEYSYELYTKLSGEQIPAEESEVVYNVTLWTAPGVGIVKSAEVSGSDVTNTELQKITKQ